jgi:hypothetical protein
MPLAIHHTHPDDDWMSLKGFGSQLTSAEDTKLNWCVRRLIASLAI